MPCYYPALRLLFQLPPIEQTDAAHNLDRFGTLPAGALPPFFSTHGPA